MFCALKGAGVYPSCFRIRQKAAAKTLLPTSLPVPASIKELSFFFFISCLSSFRFNVFIDSEFKYSIYKLSYRFFFPHLGVMPIKNSKLIPGIGRDNTERYSSSKRLLTVPFKDKSAQRSENPFSRVTLLMK